MQDGVNPGIYKLCSSGMISAFRKEEGKVDEILGVGSESKVPMDAVLEQLKVVDRIKDGHIQHLIAKFKWVCLEKTYLPILGRHNI